MFHYSTLKLRWFRYPQDGYSFLASKQRAALVYQAPFTRGWHSLKINKFYNLPYQIGELVNETRAADITYVQLNCVRDGGKAVLRCTGRVHRLVRGSRKAYVLEVIPYIPSKYGLTLTCESQTFRHVTRISVPMDRWSDLCIRFMHDFEMEKIPSFHLTSVMLGSEIEAWRIWPREN